MTYTEAVNYIHSLLKFGMNLGLERISALLEVLGNPQNGMKFIHIAGTNGKGTTSTMLSNILVDAGYKTGLFTSPYVFDFCERIQINNKNIPQNDLADIVSEVKQAVETVSKNGLEPTEFEAITAAALLYFKRMKCDYAVMEVGLGGRFDSTNIIPCPEAAVITSISLDHMTVLGDTAEKIAYEKCGIIKNGGRVVITSFQDPEALGVIKKTALEKNARLYIADGEGVEIISEGIDGTDIKYKGKAYHIGLVGRHQVENTLGVITAAELLDGVTEENISNGIKNTVMHGRMELIKPNVMLDGGHNEECSLALKAVIERFIDKDITAVIGMMADKECEKYLGNILPLCKNAVFTEVSNPRSEKPENLFETAKKYIKNIYVENNPVMAYDKAVSLAGESGFVLLCGSFYMLSDIFKL